MYKRGDVYLIEEHKTQGNEIKKMHPSVRSIKIDLSGKKVLSQTMKCL